MPRSVLLQVEYLSHERPQHAPDLTAIDGALIGGGKGAHHLLLYLISLGGRTVQRRRPLDKCPDHSRRGVPERDMPGRLSGSFEKH
jgi:hypothetical protein